MAVDEWVDEDWADFVIPLESETTYVNIAVYGKSGVGKTVLAGSDDRVLFLATEDKGTISAKRLGSRAVKKKIESWADIEEAYKKLYEAGESDKGIPFDWVVIDSVTHMQKMAMRAILDNAVDSNPERDPDIPQIQEWQKYYEMFKRFILAFNDLPVNVLYTALIVQKEDEEGNTYLAPDLQGSAKNDIAATFCSYMTSYGCMQVKRRKVKEGEKETVKEFRRITWKDTGIIQGKDRTQVLAPWTDDKTLKEIRLMIEAADLPEEAKTTPEVKTAVKAVANNKKESASA
ncbi:RecA-like recombinase [Nocardia phage P3.1]|nr:RecA-like recombinase [Nocardia phage P3.1]